VPDISVISRPDRWFCVRLGLALALGAPLAAQEAQLHWVEDVKLPAQADGNSPAFWWDGQLHLFTSIGWPLKLSRSAGQFYAWTTIEVDTTGMRHHPTWIEGAWMDPDGILLGWYHHEPCGLIEGSTLTAPKIGALISIDQGQSVHDLGLILDAGDPPDLLAANGFFVGGHGDFSVVLDPERSHFYFFFTNYAGPEETQGVCVARMAYADRFNPEGKVFKYHEGEWKEPGIGGRVTPIFPARRGWVNRDPDCFWGPAVHWNTYLNAFVMLLNHAKGEPGWSQHGVYISYSRDLSRPEAWKQPKLLLPTEDIPSWTDFYPQVLGYGPRGTDTEAGKFARFYLKGVSRWEIEFTRTGSGLEPGDARDR